MPVPDHTRLRRVRAGARAILGLGIAASLGANVLAADPSLAGRLIAAWPPVALLLTIELVSRVPLAGGRRSSIRVAAAGAVAVIAAWVSYWHMVEVAETFGEGAIAARLVPLSVDGLVVVASVSLMDLSTRLQPAPTPEPTPKQKPTGHRSTAASSSGLGARVRRLAAEHPDWTRTELAEAAGCSDRSVRRYLNGSTPTGDGSPS